MACVIKYEYDDDEVSLPKHQQALWCGKFNIESKWVFVDAQHAALSEYIDVCEPCKENIIKALRGE